MQVTMTVNGTEVTRDVEPRLLLVHFLRETLGLTGTHWGCDTSNCGTCVVLVDGEPVKSCTLLAAMAAGHEVRTVEGLATAATLDPVQQGFMEEHGLQCGFCTPGMMLTARALLDRNPEPGRAGDPRGHLRPDLPLHRLRHDRPLGPLGRRAPGRRRDRPRRCRHDRRRGPSRREPPTRPPTAADRPIGFGRIQRKEDPRFVRGKGRYLDDIVLPGMLHGAILRSPLAHARIVSIDTTEALAHPKVRAVITGKDLEGLNLAWAPTLSADVQAVLATDKVRFQGQEVAFVVAEDRYSARDALELIDVEYEELPVGRRRPAARSTPAPPVIRDDKEGQTDNHIFDWEAGDKAETDAVFARADVVVSEEVVYPRVHPAPMETCGAIADYDPVDGKLTLYETTQAPHAHRTLYAMVAGIPEHKIRVIAPRHRRRLRQQGRHLPGLRLRRRRLDRDRQAGEVGRGPLREPDVRPRSPATTSCAARSRRRGTGKILAVRTHVLADHGAFNATAQPTKYPAGFFSIFTGSYDLEAAHCSVTGVYTNKAPGGVAYACSFRVTEAVYLVERMVDVLAAEAARWTRPSCG